MVIAYIESFNSLTHIVQWISSEPNQGFHDCH